MALSRRATSEIAKGKDLHPELRWVSLKSPKQAESRGLSAFNRLRMKPCLPQSECARGPSRQMPRPKEQAARLRERARHQSRSSNGVLRGAPARRGSWRRAAALAQGKAFPSKNCLSANVNPEVMQHGVRLTIFGGSSRRRAVRLTRPSRLRSTFVTMPRAPQSIRNGSRPSPTRRIDPQDKRLCWRICRATVCWLATSLQSLISSWPCRYN
jgi:hypothetical protein